MQASALRAGVIANKALVSYAFQPKVARIELDPGHLLLLILHEPLKISKVTWSQPSEMSCLLT